MFSRFFRKAAPADQREQYRRAPGKKAALGVRVLLPTGESVSGELVDLSAGGAAVRFDEDLSAVLFPTETYELRIVSLSKGNLKVRARVRSGPREGAANRFGFQFEDPGELFRQLDDSLYKYFNRRHWIRAQPALDGRVTAEVVLGESMARLDVYDIAQDGVSFSAPPEVATLFQPDASLEVTFAVPRTEATVAFSGLVRHCTATPRGLRIGCSLGPARGKRARQPSKRDLQALEEFIAGRVREMERYNKAYQ